MVTSWSFAPDGPDTAALRGPVLLTSKGLPVPDRPGVYLITCGDCLAHVGTSKGLAGRLGTLARLGHHRGSTEVLCAAFCTRQPPLVWWEPHPSVEAARNREATFKRHYGEPPSPPEKYADCKNGKKLLAALLEAAGEGTWAAGYIEAVFTVGERLDLVFTSRFDTFWNHVGKPPGPWASTVVFAYGSNMKTVRMRSEDRAPSARSAGRARLLDVRLICNKKSADGSAKANIVDSPSDVVWGVLWEVDASDLTKLDVAEGGYQRELRKVLTDGGKTVAAEVFVSETLISDAVAYDWYKALLIEGAREHELPEEYVRYLESLPAKPDMRKSEDGGSA